jgi:hypothetical protein
MTFLVRHYYDTTIIWEEGQLPRCHNCGMFCTLTALAGKHMDLALCREGAKRNKRKKMNLQCIRAFRRTFQIRDQPAHRNGNNFQIPWSYPHITRQRLGSSIPESEKGETTMGNNITHTRTWICITTNISTILQSGYPNGATLWVRNMGYQRRNFTITHIFPPWNRPSINR